MTSTGFEFVQEEPQLFGRSMGEALARLVRNRWPQNTAKRVAAAWDLDPTTAANVTRGHASERTLTKAIRAEGWGLLAPLGEAMTGHTYADHLSTLVQETDRARERLQSHRDMVRDLEARTGSVLGLAVRLDP